MLFEGFFIWWFTPPLLMQMLAVGIGIILLASWPVIFLRSQAFREIAQQLPYKADVHALHTVLKSCSDGFRKPALECLALLDRTRQEFQSQTFHSELDRIFQNLYDLSRNHVQLYTRVQKFGTAEQKRTMQHLLQQQVTSVQNSLTTLKAFSGNLTLLDTNPDDYKQMGNDLKAINDELQHVIQEV
jgi:hypothetical protein